MSYHLTGKRRSPPFIWNTGVFQRAGRLLTFTKQGDVRGRRLALETTALMSPMMAFEERHLGRHRCLSMPSTEKIHRNPLNCGTRMLYLWCNRGIVYSMLGNINYLTHIIKHILLSGHDLRAGVCCVWSDIVDGATCRHFRAFLTCVSGRLLLFNITRK